MNKKIKKPACGPVDAWTSCSSSQNQKISFPWMPGRQPAKCRDRGKKQPVGTGKRQRTAQHRGNPSISLIYHSISSFLIWFFITIYFFLSLCSCFIPIFFSCDFISILPNLLGTKKLDYYCYGCIDRFL
jgi:hypothetical protein